MAFFNNIYNKKESFYMRIKWSIIIILSVLFLAGIAYFFYFIFSPANSNQMKEIKDSWVFYSKDDPDFKFDSKYTRTIPTVDKDETFIMETTLEKPLNEANLLIKGNHQWITVYLNGNILYQREDYDAESNPGLSLAVIDLPSDYIGKKLMISVSSPYQNYAGLPPKVYIGTTGPLIGFIYSQSVPQVLTMIIAVFIAIGTFIYTIYLMYKQKRLEYSLIILSCFALALGFEAVSEDILSGILFEPFVHSFLSHLFIILTSAFIICYYWSRMIYYKKWYGIFCIIQLSIFSGVLLYAAFTSAELPEDLPIKDDDLAQLLIHALEHSFRETHAIENPLYRKIHLSIHEQEDHFIICCEHSAHYDTNIFSRGITEELDDQERFDLMMMKDVADRYTGTLTQEKDTLIDRITVQLSRNYSNSI
ncbi:sensor histidine kinase [Enterococcus faecium]|uniref:sensor histidine kinase n=1 Tax=Enterococcus faecium TaxID=1352 RepID=UPI00143234EA|nr:sensor histidine kinase [Enterococcus faecium]QIT59429.1 sensor histidine kinase [Enterococcus faecium]QIT61813.1 sensor histidine kinase [Enterococcus faecium]